MSTLRPLMGFAGIEPPTIAAVPVPFHLAQKLHAYVRIYAQARPSSRTKDLYDMLVMSRSWPLPAGDELSDAVQATFQLRATPLPTVLPAPPLQWERAWTSYVRDHSIPWNDLDVAYAALGAAPGADPRPTVAVTSMRPLGVDLGVGRPDHHSLTTT